MGTHYESLGVLATADTATIRAAYLAKARVHHPDRNLDKPPVARAQAARAMREANAAWAVLGDPLARRDYDSSLASAARRAAAERAAARPVVPPAARQRIVVPPPAAPRRAEDDELDLHDRMGCSLRVLPTIVIFVLLLGIFVFTAFAATKGRDAPGSRVTPEELLAGDCVLATTVLETVPCSTRHDAIVMAVVPLSRGCPANTAIYTLDAQRVACLRPVP